MEFEVEIPGASGPVRARTTFRLLLLLREWRIQVRRVDWTPGCDRIAAVAGRSDLAAAAGELD